MGERYDREGVTTRGVGVERLDGRDGLIMMGERLLDRGVTEREIVGERGTTRPIELGVLR